MTTTRENTALDELGIDLSLPFSVTNMELMTGGWAEFPGLQAPEVEARLRRCLKAGAYGEAEEIIARYRKAIGNRQPNDALATFYSSNFALLRGDRETATAAYLKAGEVIPLSHDKTTEMLRERDEISEQIAVVLGVSNICDLNCVSCRAQDIITYPGNMRFETFQKIVDDCCASGLTGFMLHQSNEPLLHPLIFEFLLYLEDKGASVTISTHLNSIDRFIRRARNQPRLPKRLALRYSIDGATRETYNAIRINGNFDKVLENVALIRDYCREAGIELGTGSKFVVTKQNLGELATFYHTFKEYVPYEAMTFHFAGFTEARPQIIPYVKGQAATHFYRPNHCGLPSSQIHDFIHDGRQILCCHDPNDMSVIGSIEDPLWLENWWSGDDMKRIRGEMKAGNLDQTHKLCQGCYFPITSILSLSIHRALHEMFRLNSKFGIPLTDRHIVDRLCLELRLNGYDLLADGEPARYFLDEEAARDGRTFIQPAAL